MRRDDDVRCTSMMRLALHPCEPQRQTHGSISCMHPARQQNDSQDYNLQVDNAAVKAFSLHRHILPKRRHSGFSFFGKTLHQARNSRVWYRKRADDSLGTRTVVCNDLCSQKQDLETIVNT